ncbi:MAG: hypothetical protein Ct9H300mP28_28470 [Pseudomonadota bacterium]|nr:MAG: hypothetical protein Ct9H300mP28_28470 [Pseudomonadota bacterium]
MKTKPTQHSVGKLREMAYSLNSHCRTLNVFPPKFAANFPFHNVPEDSVVNGLDVESYMKSPDVSPAESG